MISIGREKTHVTKKKEKRILWHTMEVVSRWTLLDCTLNWMLIFCDLKHLCERHTCKSIVWGEIREESGRARDSDHSLVNFWSISMLDLIKTWLNRIVLDSNQGVCTSVLIYFLNVVKYHLRRITMNCGSPLSGVWRNHFESRVSSPYYRKFWLICGLTWK